MIDVTILKKIKRQKTGCLVNNIVKMSNDIITKVDITDDTMIYKDIDISLKVNGYIYKED